MSEAIQVSAAIIFRDDHRFLIARKKTGKPLAGYWEFPGGKIEPNESPEKSICREIKEELNIHISNIQFYFNYHYVAENADILFFFYLCTVEHLSAITLLDHDDTAWVIAEELKQYNIAPADQIAVEMILNKGFGDYCTTNF